MASIYAMAKGGKIVQFLSPDGKLKTIRIGRLSMRQATAFKVNLEALIGQTITGVVDDAVSRWLAGLHDAMHRRLVRVGLVAPRQTNNATLGAWCEEYRRHRADVSPGTSANYETVGKRLLAFFEAGRELRSITEADTDRWLVWLKQKYAGATVCTSIKFARQLWSQAIRDGLVAHNPFTHLCTPSERNPARVFFVSTALFEQVLEACPDDDWRLLLALARYGGLRTPSEQENLNWSDVNWERGRFRVVSPKTRRHDGGERWIPLFPRLRPYFDRVRDKAEPGAVRVLKWSWGSRWALRDKLLGFLFRAGIKPWPRLFQNLRASLETELVNSFPLSVVAQWLGNSPEVASSHYLVTTEEHYRLALQNPIQHPVAPAGNERKIVDDGITSCDPMR